MAEMYPNSKFYGVDISYVFPETIRPANVDLVIGNITKCIPYPDNTFHYVHQRLLMAGLTNDDWEHVSYCWHQPTYISSFYWII